MVTSKHPIDQDYLSKQISKYPEQAGKASYTHDGALFIMVKGVSWRRGIGWYPWSEPVKLQESE